ncbi:hypothetical protein HMPREF9554_02990 [Treponema phagedenis F0421]|nr:hypothetical protein HMPREF9554_02990 [Treponema phagedenis F0421]
MHIKLLKIKYRLLKTSDKKFALQILKSLCSNRDSANGVCGIAVFKTRKHG